MIKQININEVRKFTTRNGGNVGSWLPSIGGNFEKTFTLKGENYDGSNSTGEINSNTVFGKNTDELGKKYDNTSVLDDNLLKFSLVLYCLLQDPIKNTLVAGPAISRNNNIKNDRLFDKDLEQLFFNLQTYNLQTAGGNLSFPQNDYAKSVSRSLTCDSVRYYRGNKVENLDPINNEQIFTNLINYAQKTNGDYQKNVSSVLGRVTYDSIVKHTLYSLLRENNIVKNIEMDKGDSWIKRAQTAKDGAYDIFVDVSGGPYLRAFPVVCVVFSDSSGKPINNFIDKANNLVGENFKRNLNEQGTNQLVSVINDKEKNFLEIPLRDSNKTNSSIYCIVYDLVKVLVLDPVSNENNFLDLIKIGLSLLSRKGFEEKYKFTKTKLLEEIGKIKEFLKSNFSNLEANSYTVLFQNKHNLESSYILKDAVTSLRPLIGRDFPIQLDNLCKSLEDVYQKILNNINYNYFYLHFDNFYNLLAISTDKPETIIETPDIIPGPFVLEDYKSKGIESDLINLFFEEITTVPQYADGLYKYNQIIAKTQKILFITDAFVSELYEILDNTGAGLFYETDENSNIDNVKIELSSKIDLLNLINKRTDFVLNKDDYFIKDLNGKIKTKQLPSGLGILNIKDLPYSFTSVGIEKIKLQTLSHFLFVSQIDNPKDDDFLKIVYYPRLKLSTSPSKKEDPDAPPPPPPPPPPPGIEVKKLLEKPEENRDFLINNIITSELSCYEDIAESVDKLINSDIKSEKKLYLVFQVIYNIGYPFLLATASQIISSQLSELLKQGDSIDPELLACVNKDLDKVKKTIINYADLLANLDNAEQLAGLFLQEVPEIPSIPQIQYLFTFDSEKELKRKVIEYVINEVLKFVSGMLRNVLRSFVDICNADSYLNSFLQSAFDLGQSSGAKLGTPTPSGMPVGNSIPVYIPASFVDINNLIEESGLETKEYVYNSFRKTFFVDDKNYSDNVISLFFTDLSAIVDAGEMASLLKGTSMVETRNVILNFIKNYLVSNGVGKFNLIISDDQGVLLLFSFLSQYINYRLCYEKLSSSLANFTPTVCFNPNSKYDENINYFSNENINDQISDLTKTLDDLCSSKLPKVFDLLDNGPTVVAKGLVKTIVNGVESALGYNPPKTDSQIAGVPNNVEPKTPQMIYDSAKFFTETANTLQTISKLKQKSSYVLNEAFKIGMSFTDYTFVITYPEGQSAGIALINNPSPEIKDNKIIAVQSPTAKLFQRLGYENNITNTKYVDFENHLDITQEFISDFLNSIKWQGVNVGPYSGNNDSTDNRKISDNFVVDQYFSKNTQVPENVAKLWKIVRKEGILNYNNISNEKYQENIFISDLLWLYYLYLLSNFYQPFISKVLEPVNSEKEDAEIKILFKTLQESPSLEQYYIFAAKIYQMAYNLEKELLSDTIISKDLEPWLGLDIIDFSNYAINKGSYTNEIKEFINSLGNYAIKTDETAIGGYLKKYEVFRKTNTKIYDSKNPGESVKDPALVISFVDKG